MHLETTVFLLGSRTDRQKARLFQCNMRISVFSLPDKCVGSLWSDVKVFTGQLRGGGGGGGVPRVPIAPFVSGKCIK